MRNKYFLLFFILTQFYLVSVSAQSAPSAVVKAVIVSDEAFVYNQADFDAQVIGTAKKGQLYDISKGKKGPFHKIRLKPGLVGFISEIDLRTVTPGQAKKISANRKIFDNQKSKKNRNSTDKKADDPAKADSEKASVRPKVKPIEMTRYRGPLLQYVEYAEDTIGERRKAPLFFYGMKWSGPNTLMAGESYIDSNLLFFWGAPAYYSDVTGKGAEGWILLADFLFETDLPQSKDYMVFFGFGPMFKYSHINATLRQSGRDTGYSLDDMSVGAVFNAGLAFRIQQRYALRGDIKYYWEKQQYFASGLSFQFDF